MNLFHNSQHIKTTLFSKKVLKVSNANLMIVTLVLVLLNVQSYIVTNSLPSLYYDNEMLQIGSQMFNQAMNTATSPNYRAEVTKTFTKMNKNLPNAYQAFVSWRGVNFFFHRQSLGAVSYSLQIIQKNPGDIKIAAQVDKGSVLIHIIGIYFLIHESLVSSQLIYGKQFSINIPCVGASPALAICDYPQSFAIQTGWTPLIFIRYLRFYRDQAFTTMDLDLGFSVEILDPSNINIKLLFGFMGKVQEFAVSIIVYQDILTDTSTKRQLMIAPFQTPIPVSSTTLTSYDIPLPLINVYENSLFVGLSRILSKQMQFYYDIYPDLVALTLKGYIHFADALSFYKGFAIYGYKCTDPLYFNQISQQCEICPIQNCRQCVADPFNVVSCNQCVDNYLVSADKFSCQCNMDSITGVCDTLLLPDQLGCVNAQRVNGDLKCLFCSPTQYKKLENNACHCMNGFHDDNRDGVCQQTCGDGLIFKAECDDGNLNMKDGCSPNCIVQENFVCDKSQPSYCKTLQMLRYKFGQVKKIQGQNKAEITLFVKNTNENLPFQVLKEQFLPESTQIKLFILNQGQSQENEITELSLIQIDKKFMIRFVFPFDMTLQSFQGKVVINYEKTRYLNDSQEIKFSLKGIDLPLLYSENLHLFKIIKFCFLALTILTYVSFLIGLITPKFIGLQSILTLQLIFYSQILIENPSKWPVGFMYLKYLKFSCGINDILQLTDYRTQSVSTKKYFHLQMNKTLVQNFNINFVILILSFIVFIVIFLIKYKKQSEYFRNQFNRKYLPKGEYKPVDINQLLILIEKLKKMSDKAFWMVNYLSFWLVLPLIASFSASVFIQNNLVTTNIFNSIDKLFVQLGSTIGTISMIIILIICLNNFMNLWLSQQQMRKLALKPEEINYKRALFIYLLVIGMMILFFNKTKLSMFHFSVVVLIVQVSFTLLIIYIHPYKQSLRIHTVTLLINQGIYILFLVLVNLINFSQNINEIYVIVFGYIITVSCFISVILAGLRLFYQLKYGETLQRQIMKEKQRNDKTDQLRKQQLYKRRMKKLKNLTLQNASDSQKLRAKNRFLYQNQINEDKAKDTLQWLDKRKWDPEDKQKYFIQKSIFKPLEWLQSHDKEQFEQQRAQNEIYEKERREKREKIMSDSEYKILRENLGRQGDSKVREWNRKLESHEKRIRMDVNYVMEVKKDDMDRYIKLQYLLKR